MKHSKQRTAVLNELSSRNDHPKADELYDALRNRIPNISIATVYRNLSKLSHNGTILKLTCDDNADRFDAKIAPHYHLYCKECKNIYDLDVPVFDDLNDKVNESSGSKVDKHEIIFYGLCADCLKNK